MARLHAQTGIASGYATPADPARSASAGFTYHLVKPVTFETLREHVSRFRYADPAA